MISFVSVIIPCLNEELSIARCVKDAARALADQGYPCEIIVVDNGSNDNSVVNAQSSGATVYSCLERGYGAAIDYGILRAKGDVVLVMDGDGSYDLSTLSLFFDAVSKGAEFVNGNRFNRASPEPGAMPWLHENIGNPFFRAMAKLFFSANFRDLTSGIYCFPSASYDGLKPCSRGFEACLEIKIKAINMRLSTTEVLVKLVKTHPQRCSKLRTFRDGFRHFLLMLTYFLSRKYVGFFIPLLFKFDRRFEV